MERPSHQVIKANGSSSNHVDVPNDSSHSLGSSLRDFAWRYNNELTLKVDQLLTLESNFDNTVYKYEVALREKKTAISEAEEFREENRKLVEENQKLRKEISDLGKQLAIGQKAHTDSFQDVMAKGMVLFESLSTYSASIKHNPSNADSKHRLSQNSAAEKEGMKVASAEPKPMPINHLDNLKELMDEKKKWASEQKLIEEKFSKHIDMKLLWDKERTNLLERIKCHEKDITGWKKTVEDLKEHYNKLLGYVPGAEEQHEILVRDTKRIKLQMVSEIPISEGSELQFFKVHGCRDCSKYWETIEQLEIEVADFQYKIQNIEPVINAMAAMRTEHYQKAEQRKGSLTRVHDEGALLTAGMMAYYGGDGLVDEALSVNGSTDSERWGEMFQDRYKRKLGTFADTHPLLQRNLNCAATIKAIIPVNSGIHSSKERSAAKKTITKIDKISNNLDSIDNETEAEARVIHLEELVAKIVQLDVKTKKR